MHLGLQGAAILGMGNPLLDISAEVPEDGERAVRSPQEEQRTNCQETFARYGLRRGDAILADSKHEELFAELASLPNAP